MIKWSYIKPAHIVTHYIGHACAKYIGLFLIIQPLFPRILHQSVISLLLSNQNERTVIFMSCSSHQTVCFKGTKKLVFSLSFFLSSFWVSITRNRNGFKDIPMAVEFHI